ncbi:beta-lactamase [Flammeovirgaceae bacterium 311]|nr:beta-lactamase [Flammeovirgaceae bacterium 311]
MKSVTLAACSLLIYLIVSCSSDQTEQLEPQLEEISPTPYLYRPPVTEENGLPVARLKKEELAEAFVTRLSTKAPAGLVVMQQEKLVLEEYFNKDFAAFVCTGPLFPPYVGVLLGSVYTDEYGVPFKPIPLEEIFPPEEAGSSLALISANSPGGAHLQEQLVDRFDTLMQEQTGTTQGMAAEEFLFEPLQIDDYSWNEGSLCMHPHDILKTGSIWVKRGRWGTEQLLPSGFVERVLAPAYSSSTHPGAKAFGWQYYRLVAKGRKQPVLYWQYQEVHLFLLPEIEAVVLLQGKPGLMPDAWNWMQQFLIPSLVP